MRLADSPGKTKAALEAAFLFARLTMRGQTPQRDSRSGTYTPRLHRNEMAKDTGMKHFLAAMILFCTASLAMPAAAEETFHGEWQQIASNAGDCPSCRISIRQTGASLQIIANNDWTAIAETGAEKTAGGAGFWKRGTRKTYSGKSFNIKLRRNDANELIMLMRIEPIRGQSRTIKGVFQRIEQLKI